jgi:endogenous inhibitor of DNA gyrase (YacG/DUF329 family)
MSEEKTKTIVCVRCGAKVETTGSGDFTTFVCETCQDKVNLPAYKQEVEDIETHQLERVKNKEERLPSFDKRKAFLEAKIEKLEEVEEK